MDDKKWFNSQEAANYLGITLVWLKKLRARKPPVLPGTKVNQRATVYTKQELDEYLTQEHKVGRPATPGSEYHGWREKHPNRVKKEAES